MLIFLLQKASGTAPMAVEPPSMEPCLDPVCNSLAGRLPGVRVQTWTSHLFPESSWTV